MASAAAGKGATERAQLVLIKGRPNGERAKSNAPAAADGKRDVAGPRELQAVALFRVSAQSSHSGAPGHGGSVRQAASCTPGPIS